MRIITTFTAVVALIASVLVGVGAPTARADETDMHALLTERWAENMTGGGSYDPADPQIAARIAGITDTAQGWWGDLAVSPDREYLWADTPDPEGTPSQMTTSYTRLSEMALAFATHGSALEGDVNLAEDIREAMQWLYDHAYNETRSGAASWWNWQIGVPLKLLDTLTLMQGEFTDEEITTFLLPVQKFPKISGRTGANLLWIAQVYGRTAALLGTDARLEQARDAVSGVLPYVQSGDGFYEDGSFIQHKTVGYTGGYGVALIRDVGWLVAWLDGTPWEVTDPAVGNVIDWVYRGYEPLMNRGLMMDMVRGREISRDYSTDHVKGHEVISAVMTIADFASADDAAALRGMVKYWIASDTYRDYFAYASIPNIVRAQAILADDAVAPRPAPAQYQQFAAMDRAVQQREDYAFALSMSSDRIGTHESINRENLHGWYTGEGMTYLYNADIGHYTDTYWPTVDPYRLPGTTVDTRTRTDGSGNKYRSPDRWAGGVELDEYGTSVMRVAAHGSSLVANKSWFAFDDEIVALGSGITASDGRSIETTVENRQLAGAADQPLTINGTTVTSPLGWNAELTDVETVHLGGNVPGADLGYYFPGGAQVDALREERTGSWRDIDGRATSSTDPITEAYYTMWYDHGVDPTNATYEYALLPGQTSAAVEEYGDTPDFTVLENSETVQAVREHTLDATAAQFWAPGTAGGITADAPSSVMVDVESDGIVVGVSDPTQRQSGTVTIDLDLSATAILAADPGVQVTQLDPVQIEVDVSNARGATLGVHLSTVPPTQAPATPTPLEPVVEDGQLVLGWEPVPGASEYTVRYGSASGAYGETLNAGARTSVALTEVTWGEPLYYTVTATNSVGSSDPSAEGVVTPRYQGVIDDADPEVEIVGEWPEGARDGVYGVGYLHDMNSGKGDKSVTYPLDLEPGVYRVSAWWVEHPNRASNVPITITHVDGEETVHVDQRSQGSEWNELGVFTFYGEPGEQVVISTEGTNGHVVADAIQVEQISSPETPLWDAEASYDTDDRVRYDSAYYVAQWPTRSHEPGASPWSAWAEVGDVVETPEGEYREWTSSWIYDEGDTVAHDGSLWRAGWWSRNQEPSAQQGNPWEEIG